LREEAMLSLGRAMELEPDSPRYTYVYAVALHSEGRPQEAIQLLQSALRRWPGNREMSEALAAFQQR
ncbi:MAG: tetratricopeptide repeat protein, partial [Steroidobacteraceae bacterium]